MWGQGTQCNGAGARYLDAYLDRAQSGVRLRAWLPNKYISRLSLLYIPLLLLLVLIYSIHSPLLLLDLSDRFYGNASRDTQRGTNIVLLCRRRKRRLVALAGFVLLAVNQVNIVNTVNRVNGVNGVNSPAVVGGTCLVTLNFLF